MIHRAFRLLSYEVRGLHAAVYVLAASALLSSLLALVRDRLLAHTFGASTTLDLYYAAFRIPDLIFVGTGALVSVYILIPELVRRSSDAQRDYIDTILVGFSVFAICVSGIATLLAPLILALLFPILSAGSHHDELILMTRIILLQPILLGVSNILAAVTQTKQRYALYSISPLLYNLGMIIGVIFFYPFFGIQGLAWGVVFGALMHAGIQLPSIIGDGFFRALPRVHDVRALIETVSISIPRALALLMGQVTFIGLTALAGLLTPGSIAIFIFAYNLQAVPLSVIGASYSVAAFPTLAAALARGSRKEFIEHIATAARYVFFWSLPVTALFIVLRAHIVRVVLGSGAFDWTDTRLTAAALAVLCLSLSAQGLVLLLVRGYYAAGRTFVPFFVSSAMAAGAVGLGALLLGVFQNHSVSSFAQTLLRVSDVPGASVLMLAIAYTAVSILGALALAIHFEYRFGGFFARVARSWAESLVCALCAGVAAYGALLVVGPITFASTTLSIFARGFAGGVFGIIVSALVYWIAGNREFKETVESIRSRFEGVKAPPTPSVAVVSAEESTSTSPQG